MKNYLNPLVANIIVNYNSSQDCLKLLSSLESLEYNNIITIVVDNNSLPEELKKIKSNTKADVFLLENKENLGFGAGVNFALKFLKKYEPKYVQIINPDSKLINQEYLRILVEFLEKNSNVALVGPAVLKGDELSIQNTILPFPNLSSVITFKQRYNQLSYESNPVEFLEVECVNGVVFLARYKCIMDINGFDERYFMYCEEQDLCYRLNKLGKRIVFASIPSIIHFGADRPLKDFSWQELYIKRNLVYFFLKHKTRSEAVVLKIILLVAALLKKRGTRYQWKKFLTAILFSKRFELNIREYLAKNGD